MLCPKRDQRFENYRHDVDELSRAVLELKNKRDRDDYDEMFHKSEEVRHARDDARSELKRHREEHGC
jgi:hypothetical protein